MKRSLTIVLLAGVLASGCGQTTDDPAAALKGSWSFDEAGGDEVADASGSGNTAKIRNGARDAGGALAMNGGNDGLVVVPLTDSLRSTDTGITVAAWTYRTASHNVAIVAHGYPTLFFGFHGPQFKWEFQTAGSHAVECYADPKFEALLDRWIHVAATYDGWRARLYADGAEICSKWWPGSIKMPELPFTIGGYLDDKNQIVDEITGRLDDVRIYNRALTPTQIEALHAERLHAP